MRLFYAINASCASPELLRLQRSICIHSPDANFVPPQNFHITLRFIGESDRLGELALALQTAARGIRPFELKLDKFDCFDRGHTSAAYCNVKGDLSELNALHESLEAALFDAGFAREGRPLKPHITLARETVLSNGARLSLRTFPLTAVIPVNSVSLYRSTREHGVMVYTPIHTENF